MEEPRDRLKRARAKKFKSARAAAKHYGWPESSYAAHENGQNRFDPETAAIYAKAFGVKAGWLLTGEGPEDANAGLPPADVRVALKVLINRYLRALGARPEVADAAAPDAAQALLEAVEAPPEPAPGSDRETAIAYEVDRLARLHAGKVPLQNGTHNRA